MLERCELHVRFGRCVGSQSLNLTPSLAKRSMFGVSISDPKHPTSEKPRSSATMRRMLGRGAAMMLRGRGMLRE